MATRFMCKAPSIAALGIALSLVLAATPTVNPAMGKTAGAPQLDPPAAPSHAQIAKIKVEIPDEPTFFIWGMGWNDKSSNEDGFTAEVWWRNPAGEWVLSSSSDLPANSTTGGFFYSNPGPDIKFRVKAFNAAGDSDWSNWGH